MDSSSLMCLQKVANESETYKGLNCYHFIIFPNHSVTFISIYDIDRLINSAMGCNRSKTYHDNEVGVDHKDLALTTFEMQKADVICDLDTDNDQKGRVAVDCIFRPTRYIK